MLDVNSITFLISIIHFTINLRFMSGKKNQNNIPAMIICAMSINQKKFSFTKILYILIHGYKILKKISYFKMDH